eukprot:12159767-Prorocentrum_lima.AAC.1
MNPNLNSQLPPEGGRVIDHIRRYRGDPSMTPAGLLYRNELHTRPCKVVCKELYTRGGEGVGCKEG